MGKAKGPRITHINIPENFSVPFPPQVTPDEILSRRSEENLDKKHPNQFFIYRLAYIKELKKYLNIDNVSVTVISPHIASSWRKESINVKYTYRRLSEQVRDQLEDIRRRNFGLMVEDPQPGDTTPPIENRMIHENVRGRIQENISYPLVYYYHVESHIYQIYYFDEYHYTVHLIV